MEKKQGKQKRKERKSAGCKDRNCPLHGTLAARGKSFKGIVKKISGKRAIVEFERLVYTEKYERYSKSRTRLHAYLPECIRKDVSVGELVLIRECRPINKITHFVVERMK